MTQRDHPLYDRWVGMKRRCLDPRHVRWADYGGRGISVDPAWLDFETFADDIGPMPCQINGRWTLDRIDGDGNYEPGNVRWATDSEQNRNRRSYTMKRRETCSRGHSDWAISSSGRYCKPCYNDRQRDRRRAKRQAARA